MKKTKRRKKKERRKQRGERKDKFVLFWARKQQRKNVRKDRRTQNKDKKAHRKRMLQVLGLRLGCYFKH